MHTMGKRQGKSGTIDVKALVLEDEEFLRTLVRSALQEVLEAEMTEALGAEKGERAAGRQGYRSGYYGRTIRLMVHPSLRPRRGWTTGRARPSTNPD
jgi:transposase-like protein